MRMRPAMVARLTVVLAASLVAPSSGEPRMSSKRGVPIYDARKALRQERLPHTAAEEAELVQFLTNNGFAQYAAPAFIQEMKDTLGYGSLEDLGALEDDDAHLQVGMPEEHAEAIQEAALKELLRRFLANLESPTGGSMVKHLERLVEARAAMTATPYQHAPMLSMKRAPHAANTS